MKFINFKTEIDGEEVDMVIKPESLDAQRKCDNEYSLAYVQAIRQGIPPRSVLEKVLRDQEMWTDSDDNQLELVKIGIVKLELQLAETNTDKEGLPLARQLAELRGKLVEITQQRGEILNNSADFMAEQIRRDAFIAHSTFYKSTNKPAFASYNDFVERGHEDMVQDARRAVALEMFNEFGTFMDGLPEAQYKDAAVADVTAANEEVKTTRKKVAKTSKKKTTRKKVVSKE